MIYGNKVPFVASLWKKGAPEEFASEELVGATDWKDAERLALEWAEGHLSEGSLSVPTWLHLKCGAQGKFLREWMRP